MQYYPLNLSNSGDIYGLPEYLYNGQNERVDELNNRIDSRQFSDYPLAPNYDPRPVPTKYSLFPLINRREFSSVALTQYPDYNVGQNFSPATQNGPVSGYVSNIEVENSLRNQYFALQRGGVQNLFIPDTNSELYRVIVPSRPSEQPYPDLFSKTQFDKGIHPNNKNTNIGKEQFYNHTRTQLRSNSH
jgi:hypothetical protein